MRSVGRHFASLALFGRPSRRLDIVQIDHDERKKGTMWLYTLLDGVAATSVVNLGNWDHKDFHPQSGSISPLKGLTGSFLSLVAVRSSRRKKVLIFDPVSKNRLTFYKPPPKVSRRFERIDDQMYIGRCYLRSSPPRGATSLFKVVQLSSIVDSRQDGWAVGCEICTLDSGGGTDRSDKRPEWRVVAAAAADLPLRRQKVSLDDCFHGDNMLCWGVCRDGKDSWSVRRRMYNDKMEEERYRRNESLEVNLPTRVGSALVSILSLDLVTETLKTTALPPSLLQRPNSCRMHMCNLNGRPSICLLPEAHNSTGNLEVWMLKKDGGSGDFNPASLGDPDSWFLWCSIPVKRLPCGYLGPVALWYDKLFLLHEWCEDDRPFFSSRRAKRRLVCYDICSDELIRVKMDSGEDVVMDATSDVLWYDETLGPIWTGASVQAADETEHVC